ncbi:MAG TPA: DUF1615 domain-containing protein [Burkholderiaceae bacterium]|nr:DUF1615 domain-containing protein [Burkholderiaceae bacterium]
MAAVLAALAGCAIDDGPVPVRSALTPAEARALVERAVPPSVTRDRQGWVTDIHAALSSMSLPVNPGSVCSVVAVIEQESSFQANPKVPGLPAIAWREIDGRADRAGVPKFVVRAALALPSRDGRSFGDRIDAASTEQELSDVFQDFIGMVPMGKTLFAGYNPVRTGGPMQVSIAWAEQQAAQRPYPYPVKDSIRGEVFSRRGGLYFGIAHLLDYPAAYDRPLYRFADFNAGHYTSRNAAFQNAVTLVSGVPLALDGDLVDPKADARRAGATELAVRVLGSRLGLSETRIREDLEKEKTAQFEQTALYQRVFRLADEANRSPVPRAVLPRIRLASPKITRNLTTEWFANRVDERHQRCLARVRDV